LLKHFPSSWKRFQGDLISKFWVTDSCPTITDQLAGQAPYEVLSLSGRLANLLLEVDLMR